MPTAAPTLTAAPTSPDRADRATFAARAVALDDWTKNSHVPELQALGDNVYANAVEAAASAVTCNSVTTIAAAAANYKGLWSALTGALNMPASVSHNGNYWALNANLADVTAATPGVSASWQPLNIGAGGATETNSAVDVTLTAASYRVQAVAMTATGKSVNLPNATTLATGSDIFVIKNTGTTVFCVRDSTGTMLAALDPGKTVSLSLSNASTAAGVWVASGTEGVSEAMYQAVATAVNASLSTSASIAPLTATTALAAWVVGGFINAAVLTVSGATVSVGTVFVSTVAVIGNPPRMRITAMSASQAIVAYTSSPSSYAAAVTLNVAAGLVTAGTPLIFGTAATDYQDVSMLTSTQALVIYKGTTGYSETRTLNVSGTTLTAGTLLVVLSGSATTAGIVVAISTTQAICTVNTGAILSYSYLLTVSGTNVTAGASPVIFAASANSIAACKVSATQVLVSATAYTYNHPRYAVLEVSGSTVVLKDVMDGFGPDFNGTFDLVRISAAKFMALRSPAGGNSGSQKITVQVVNVADSALRIANPMVTLKNSSTQNGNSPAGGVSLSTDKQLVVYHDASGYVQARILEIAA